MEKEKKKEKNCGCWAVLRLSNVIGGSSDSKHSVNSIPRTSLVYDAGFLFFSFANYNFNLSSNSKYNLLT